MLPLKKTGRPSLCVMGCTIPAVLLKPVAGLSMQKVVMPISWIAQVALQHVPLGKSMVVLA